MILVIYTAISRRHGLYARSGYIAPLRKNLIDMTRAFRYVPKGAVLVLLGAFASLSAATECVKTVRWYDDAPYSMRGANGEVQGLNADFVREALARINCQPKFLEMPWARALLELSAGRLDILPGALRRPDRESFAYFSRPVNRSPNVLFMTQAASTTFSINKLPDILGTRFRLGAQIGVVYGPDFETLNKDPGFTPQLSQLTSRRSGWKMMEAGRIDGMIADEASGLAELQELGLSNLIRKTRVIVASEPAMIALSKQSNTKEFAEAFDHALGAMMVDGKYKQIREKYVPCVASVENLGCK
jgi:polar amino acid transport system substrate-binding protein